MLRLSNRHQPQEVKYVSVPSEPRIVEKLVEVPIDRLVEVPVEKIVEVEKRVEMPAPAVDLSDIHANLKKHEQSLIHFNKASEQVYTELEMQRRALISIKAQRDVDRKRRLQLIKRLKKQRDEQKQSDMHMKLAIGVGIILSILSLIIKL